MVVPLHPWDNYMRTHQLLAIALPLALATSALAATPKPCDLLSHQAAETLFAAPLAKTMPENALLCHYSNSDTSAVTVSFQAWPDFSQSQLEQVMKTLPHKDYQPDVIDSVPGLGDQNFFVTDKQIPKDTLIVLYHKTIITLIVIGSKNQNLRPAMIDAMKRAMSRF
jgi:hypothetical protein